MEVVVAGGVNILLVNVTEIKPPIIVFPNTYPMRFLSRTIVVVTSRDAAWKNNEDWFNRDREEQRHDRPPYRHCCAYYCKNTTKRYCHLRIDKQKIELPIVF